MRVAWPQRASEWPPGARGEGRGDYQGYWRETGACSGCISHLGKPLQEEVCGLGIVASQGRRDLEADRRAEASADQPHRFAKKGGLVFGGERV